MNKFSNDRLINSELAIEKIHEITSAIIERKALSEFKQKNKTDIENIYSDDLSFIIFVICEASKNHLGLQQEQAFNFGVFIVEKIVQHLGGTTVYIPNMSNLKTMKFNQSILADYESGLSTSAIALKHETSTRNVQLIVKKMKAANKK